MLESKESFLAALQVAKIREGGSPEAVRGAQLYLYNSSQSFQIMDKLGSLQSMHEGGQLEHT